MTSDDKKVTLNVLNDLIETSKDGAAGFHTCATDVKSPELRQLLERRSRQCEASAEELQALVVELGGTPRDDTSIGGDIHRRWVDLKAMVTGKDEKVVLSECERGEDVAKRHYRDALGHPELPMDIRAVIERQFDGVVRNHDMIKTMRDSYASRA
ncbi:hypothetical protein D3C76_425610 [compost metagenome]